MSDKMQRQGELTLSLDASLRILTIEATGPFGADFGEKYHDQILPLRDALKPIAWGSLAILKGGNSLINDEVKQFLIKSIKDARQLGLRVTALVLEKNTPEHIQAWWHALYRASGLHYRIFEDKHQAISFLTLTLQK